VDRAGPGLSPDRGEIAAGDPEGAPSPPRRRDNPGIARSHRTRSQCAAHTPGLTGSRNRTADESAQPERQPDHPTLPMSAHRRLGEVPGFDYRPDGPHHSLMT
jgi:hypothetical protein